MTKIHKLNPNIEDGSVLLYLEIRSRIKPKVKWERYCNNTKQSPNARNPFATPKMKIKPIPIASH